MFAFLLFFLLSCALDLVRAVVVYVLWGWFLTPWSHIVAPAVFMIWGLFVFKSCWFGFGKIEDKSVADIVVESLSANIACLVTGLFIHLFA